MVGLPRESKISRPMISAMLVCILRGYDARCACAVQQMLRKNRSGERAEDADLEQVPCGLCAQRVSKPLTETPAQGSHQRSETPPGGTDWKFGSPQEIRTGNLDLD